MKILKRTFKKFYWSPHSLFSWLAILLPPAVYFHFVHTYSLNLPFADDFAQLSEVTRIFQSENFSDQFSILFAPHNEHRVAFTRFAFMLSYILLGKIDFFYLIILGNLALLALFCLFFNFQKRNYFGREKEF